MKYYTDGSSIPQYASAFVVTDENGDILTLEESFKEHAKTNNEEEYRGIIAALNIAKDGDEIFTDSLLAVQQIEGNWRINKPELRKLCNEAREILQEKKVTLSWVRREHNVAGKIFQTKGEKK